MADARSEPQPHATPDTEVRSSDPAARPDRPPRRFQGWRLAACLPWLFLGLVPHVVILLWLAHTVVYLDPAASGRPIETRIEAAAEAASTTDAEAESGGDEAVEKEPIEEPDIEEPVAEDDIYEDESEDDSTADQPYEGYQTNIAIGLGGGAGGAYGGRRGGRRGLRRRYGSGGPVPVPVTRPAAEFGGSGGDLRGHRANPPGSATPLSPTGQWQRSEHRPSFARVYVGSGNSLQLKRMRVTVQLDGPKARTVVDHIFYNPHPRQLEGTFEYPLPSQASPCYFAMFLDADQSDTPRFFAGGKVDAVPREVLAVMTPDQMARHVESRTWGELREARVVRREQGRRVYEEITRRRIDPALLEYEGGSTFRGRVFPIAPRSFHRVILAYEEHLDLAGNAVRYRFPLPDCDLEELHVTATLSGAGVRSDRAAPDGVFGRTVANGRIIYAHTWSQTRGPGGEFVLDHVPEDPRMQSLVGPDPTEPGQAFYARLRPDLPEAATVRPWSDRAVFLLDTSFSESPDRFNASLKILLRILETDTALRYFNVMCFDVGAWWVEKNHWIPNDAAGRARALARLDRVLLEGATDLGAALDLLARTDWDGTRTPVNVFLLSDGQINWGETNAERLVARLARSATLDPRFYCYRTGLGAENLALFRALTRRGGGVYNVFDESLAGAAALAHRRPCLVVDEVLVEGTPVRDLVVAGRQSAVYPGGELVVAGRFPHSNARQAVITVRGRFQGEERVLTFPLRLHGQSPLAARAWAEIAVNQLLDTRDPSVEPLAVAYAQCFRIGTPVTSFLVLERDSDYQRFQIDEERNTLRVPDLGAFLDQRFARDTQRPSPKEVFLSVLRHVAGSQRVNESAWRSHVLPLHALLPDEAFEVESSPTPGPMPAPDEAGAGYLASRQADRRQVDAYLEEARQRIQQHRLFPGLRALSTVVEVHPGRSDALRLVGYHLLQLGQPGFAVHVFDRVRQQRPFEPHSYRDLARSLEALGHPGLAALHHEIVLAGTWHRRFGPLKTVVAEDYVRMMRAALDGNQVDGALRAFLTGRLNDLAAALDAASAPLTVTATWNTDNTDVDLWVVEPGGEACGYNHQTTSAGGELLADLLVGYGPERYVNRQGHAGTYVVRVKYYWANPNLIAGQTHVEVVVTRQTGTARETVQRFPVVLRKEGSTVEVCRIELGAPPPATRPAKVAVSE